MSTSYSHLTADLAKGITDASLNIRVGSFLLKGPYLVADPEPGLFGILVRYYASFNGLFSLEKSEELAAKYIAGLSSMVVDVSDVETVVHDVSDLSTYIHKKAESLRYNAGMAGACNDGGADALVMIWTAYHMGLSNRPPEDVPALTKIVAEFKKMADPEYQSYLKLKKKFE